MAYIPAAGAGSSTERSVERTVGRHAYLTLLKKTVRKSLWSNDLLGSQCGRQKSQAAGHDECHLDRP
jgi:hypothetical protein